MPCSAVILRQLPFLCLALVLLLAGQAGAEDEDGKRRREKAAEEAGVSRLEVAKALREGSAYLTKKYARGFDKKGWNSTLELVMLTLTHAGIDETNDVYAEGLRALETCKLQYTYRVAALALALARIDARKYRTRLAHCAQWLVDTQLKAGEWGYPRTLRTTQEVPRPVDVPAPPKADTPDADPGDRYGRRTVKIKRNRKFKTLLKGVGDISNTQFAILGLKACLDAGVMIPKPTWKDALGYIRKYQNKDGGWGYAYAGKRDQASYGSMTCAGICSIAICRYGLGVKNPGNHGCIKRGVKWLEKHFAVDKNYNIENSHVADPLRWRYYYLYSVERVGMILDKEAFDGKAWYPLGARYLLDEQKADGSWWTEIPGAQWRQAGDIHTADTCFAILFLTRSTPRLSVPVITGAPKK